jgi:protein involved in temperature-dependent protein secretion
MAREQTTRAEAVRDFMFEVFNEAQPATPGRQPPSVLDVVKDAVAAARTNRNMNAMARSELLTQLGGVLASQGDVAAARAVLEDIVRDAEQRLGPANETTLLAGRRLAEVLIVDGEYKRARALLEDLIARTPSQFAGVRGQLLAFSAYLHSIQREQGPSLAQAQEAIALCRAA